MNEHEAVKYILEAHRGVAVKRRNERELACWHKTKEVLRIHGIYEPELVAEDHESRTEYSRISCFVQDKLEVYLEGLECGIDADSITNSQIQLEIVNGKIEFYDWEQRHADVYDAGKLRRSQYEY